MTTPSQRPHRALLALKSVSRAKSRLARAMPNDIRVALTLAMFEDTVAALNESGVVDQIFVVTPDSMVADLAASLLARVIHDPGFGGLNQALGEGRAEMMHGWQGPGVIVQPDLPALRAAEFSAAVPRDNRPWVVADHHHSGTSALFLPPASHWREFPLSFGANSFALHQISGASEVTGALRGLRCDVDTPEDLAAAIALGVGTRTAAVLLAERERISTIQ